MHVTIFVNNETDAKGKTANCEALFMHLLGG